MLDRASTFADPEIIALLKERFIPVAIDQWYTRRQQDNTGEFWRKIAGQGPRSDFSKTTQGLYLADPAGTLIAYNNNRGPERIRNLLNEAADSYQPPAGAHPLEAGPPDGQFDGQPPEGTAVIRVSARVTGGYEPTDDPWQTIFQNAISRDNLWITPGEQQQLAAGEFPAGLARRIARFHLIDNTRGEAPVWEPESIRRLDVTLRDGKITGRVELERASGERGFHADLHGECVVDEAGRLKQFDLLAQGEYWGAGEFTRDPPPGRFPLDVAFQLADGSDVADSLAPHGSRGWIEGYLDQRLPDGPKPEPEGETMQGLERITWELYELRGVPMEFDRPLTVQFEGGTLQAFGGVNRLGGNYQLGESRLSIGPLHATRMAGPPELMELEQMYADMLTAANGCQIENRELNLLDGAEVIARFREGR